MDHQICGYRDQLRLIKGIAHKTNKLTIELPNSERMLFFDPAEVRLMNVGEAIVHTNQSERPAQNKSELTAPPLDPEHEPYNKIQLGDISVQQMSEAATRLHAIKAEVAGIISVQVAAEMCDLSFSRYYQINRLDDPQVGFCALLSQRRGRKPKALNPHQQPDQHQTHQKHQGLTVPTREGR